MKEKVNVTGVPETMVQTLYARAKETKKQNAKIRDEIAVELVEKLDYDFSKADKDKAMNCGVIARTIVLDQMVKQYLEKHANTVVINIACGLDTRCYRMERKYLHWYNVDLSETMKIRSQFLTETGPVYQIAKSAMDESYVRNILVIGTDSRDLSEECGRSDSMILLSMNSKSNTFTITSFLRDAYVEIPGNGWDRLNAAYSYGGAELLMDTIESNFQISVDDYVLFTFAACSDLIQAAGGVDLDLSDEEVEEFIAYIKSVIAQNDLKLSLIHI